MVEYVNKGKMRLTNFEVLRIVAMFLILAHHFTLCGNFTFSRQCVTIPQLWLQFIEGGGKIGVNIFVLISGYFLIEEKEVRISKIIKLWITMVTYSLGIYVISICGRGGVFETIGLVKSLMPVTFRCWWFASVYFIFYLLTPYLNLFLKTLSRNIFQKLIVLLFFLWSFMPTLTTKYFESNDLLWFIFLYLIAAYIKLWHMKTMMTAKKYFLVAISGTLMTFLTVTAFDLMGMKVPIFFEHANYFYGGQRVPTLIISISIFLGFKDLRIRSSKWINLLSSATFGVYLIHSHAVIADFLGERIFGNQLYSNKIVIIPYSMCVITMVYIICTGIELVRIHILESRYMKLIYKIEPRINCAMNSIIIKFQKIF